MSLLTISYRFVLEGAGRHRYDVVLDEVDLALQNEPMATPPAWCRLQVHQCDHCPLDAARHPYCPVALRLAEAGALLGGAVSYQPVDLEVVTPQRRILQRTTAQMSLASLLGLLIPTCGCPHTAFFRPMARFHLPLATIEETLVRAASAYLLCQYLHHQGDAGSWEGLDRIYDDIHRVNAALGRRLRAGDSGEAAINALALLDMYALAVPQLRREVLAKVFPDSAKEACAD